MSTGFTGISFQRKDADLTQIASTLQGTSTGVLKKTATDQWALDATLYSIGAIGVPSDGTFLVGDGNKWVGEDGSTARQSLGIGSVDNKTQQFLHGFPNRADTSLAFDNSTHVFTLGVASSAVIYLNGIAYTVSSPGLTIDLDTKTLSSGLWFIWVEISGGNPVLNASKNAWSILNLATVPVATVYWNGAAGAVAEERHSAYRNLEVHRWQHLTVGARVVNDGSFSQVYPTTGQSKLELTAGTLYDEEIDNVITSAQCKLVRNWYETAAGTWTFADGTDNGGYNRPYIWNGSTSRIRFPKSDSSYALTDVSSNGYIALFVYASNDVTRPIYVVTPSATSSSATLQAARLVSPSILPFMPELKLLWRFIFKGDGSYTESTDYRTYSSLPSGGVSAINALSVLFTPTTNVTSPNVQAAIEEIDTKLYGINALSAPADSTFMVGDGAKWVAESGNTVRTSLGLGTADSPQFTALVVGAGTVSAPSIARTTDLDTGLFFPAAGSVAITVDGTERLRISGNRFGLCASISNWHVSTIPYSIDFGTVTGFYENSNGSLGIVTNAIYSNSTNSWLYKTSAAASLFTQSNNSTQFMQAAAGTAGNACTFVEKFVIDSLGNTVIGCTDSSQVGTTDSVLVVAKSGSGAPITQISYRASPNTGCSIRLRLSKTDTIGTHAAVADGDSLGTVQYAGSDGTNWVNAGYVGCSVDGTVATDNIPGQLIFYTRPTGIAQSPTARMWIKADGKVGIGTNGPTKTLSVNGDLSVENFIYLKSTDSSGTVPAIGWNSNGRLDYGWTRSGGGQIELYHTSHASKGSVNLVFGGDSAAKITCVYYAGGSTWNEVVSISSSGLASVTAIKEVVYTISDGASFEINPANGGIQLITLGNSRTPKGTNFAAGQSVTLMILDGSSYSITWTDSTFGTSGVKWVGGSAPTLDTTKYTVVELWKVSTQVYGALVGYA